MTGPPFCTGVAASWCPVCGDCVCPRDERGEAVSTLSPGDFGKDDPNCPLHARGSKHAEACWLILCTDEPGHGAVGLWWKAGAAGYTRDLDKAGRWTEEGALARTRAGRDMPVRLSDVEGHAYRVVPLDHIEGAWKALRENRR